MRRTLLWPAAVIGPIVVAGLLSLGRTTDVITATNAALALAVVVVLIALAGDRWVGTVAALAAGAGYDFFWTSPLFTLAIDDRDDLETTVLLVLAGVVVSQLARADRRHRQQAADRSGYLDRVQHGVFDPTADRDAVEQALATLLEAERCRFRHGPTRSATMLLPDGAVTQDGEAYDVERAGLPTDEEVVIATPVAGAPTAHLEIVAAARVARPDRPRRQAAVLLATGAAPRVLVTVKDPSATR